MGPKLQSRISIIPPIYAAWAVIALCIAVLFVRYPGNFASFQHGPPAEFAQSLRAWSTAQAGANPYVATAARAYRYSPTVLALVSVLPKSPQDAWYWFSTLTLFAFGAALLLGARYRRWRSVGLLLLGLALAWKGILEALDHGEPEILLLSIAVFSAATLRRAPFVSGLLLGALPWFKLPWILLLFPFFLRLGKISTHKRGRMLVSGYFFSWFVWGAAVPSLVFGPERAKFLFQQWLELLRTQPGRIYLSDVNQSFWMLGFRWIGGSPILAFGIVGVVCGFLLGRFTARTLKSLAENPQAAAPVKLTVSIWAWLSPWLVFIQLINPLSWRWGSVVVVGIPFAAVVSTYGSRFFRAFALLSVVVLWLLQLNPVVQLLGFGHWSELHHYGVVTFYWLALLLLSL